MASVSLVSILLLAVSWAVQAEKLCISEKGNCLVTLNCEQCKPLKWLVRNANVISNNSLVVFLPGNHTLNSTGLNTGIVNFTNKDNVSLTGSDGDNSSIVQCHGIGAGFLFQLSVNIYIHKINLNKCGVSLTNTSALQFLHSANITLSHVAILNSTTYSLIIDGVSEGYVEINKSKFIGCGMQDQEKGNILLLADSCQSNRSITINFNSTEILIYNQLYKFGDKLNTHTEIKGLHLWIHQPMVTVTIRNVTMENNRGRNVEINMLNFNQNPSRVYFMDCFILNGRSNHSAGVYVTLSQQGEAEDDLFCRKEHIASISFTNTTFHGNIASKSGGAFQLRSEIWRNFCSQSNIVFFNCNFTHNYAKLGGALLMRQSRTPSYIPHIEPQLSVYINNCTFMENGLQIRGDGIIRLYEVDSVLIKNTYFTKNNGSALLLMDSTVLFEGNINFSANNASYGAAIRVCKNSLFFIKNNTYISFENNKAEVAGGAIYAGDQCLQVIPKCFYQPLSNSPMNVSQLKNEISLNFIDNTASLAGDAIYGGSVDHCFTLTKFYPSHPSGAVFDTIFHFTPDTASKVTSDPSGVCICHPDTGQPNCTVKEVTLQEQYPGKRFTVNVTAVGQTHGTVPAPIHVTGKPMNVKVYDYNQPISAPCQSITLAVFSQPNSTVSFNMSAVEANPAKEHSIYYHQSNLKFIVPTADCPWIFELNTTTNSCDCNSIFNNLAWAHVSCNISSMSINKYIYRNVWISYTKTDDLQQTSSAHSKIEVDRHCRYCHDGIFTPTNLTTSQCTEGREGRLCGSCTSNFSLSLGHLECINTADNCSIWKTFVLIITFLLAGILLIFALAVLNFTVTKGTVNGVLYFVNSIHTNQNIFFHYRGYFNKALRVIISWMNLDLGFQVCLYSGMTAYQKIWLEYCFLLYLLLLGVLIVCFSRKSIWFTRLVGRNVVPVLSTVVSISFYKLVMNPLKVFTCSDHLYWSTDKKKPLLWLEDETMDCFTGKHIPLFLISLFLIIAAIAYIVCLLTIQCLQRSDRCMLKWVNKLRPFFDAHTGACRDHYRFWPGLLLLLRFIVIVFKILTLNDDKARLRSVAIITVLIFLVMFVLPRGVYKKWHLNVIEFFLFFYLGITFVVVSVNNYVVDEEQANAIMAVAVLLLTAVFLYHIYKRFSKIQCWVKMITWVKNKCQYKRRPLNDQDVVINENVHLIHPQLIPRVVNFNAPREPLLENN